MPRQAVVLGQAFAIDFQQPRAAVHDMTRTEQPHTLDALVIGAGGSGLAAAKAMHARGQIGRAHV